MKKQARGSGAVALVSGLLTAGNSSLLDRNSPASLTQLSNRLDDIMTFTDANLSVYKDMAMFLRKKFAAEEDTARGVCKTAKSILETARIATESGNQLARSWEDMLLVIDSHSQRQADMIAQTASSIPDNLKELEQTRKVLKGDTEKIIKALKNVYSNDQKARAKYLALFNEATALATSQSADPKGPEKIEQNRKKLLQAEKEMKDTTAAVNQAHELYYNQELTNLWSKYRTLNEQVGVFIEGLFRSFFALLVESIPLQQSHQSDVSVFVTQSDYLKAMQQLDAIRDSDAFTCPPPLQILDPSDVSQIASIGVDDNDGMSGQALLSSEAEVLFCGWLTKQGDSVKSWKRRWCVLSADFTLSYFEKREDLIPKGKVILPSYAVGQASEVKQPFAFKISHNNTRTYIFAAENEEDMRKWIAHLSAASQLRALSSDNNEIGVIRAYPTPPSSSSSSSSPSSSKHVASGAFDGASIKPNNQPNKSASSTPNNDDESPAPAPKPRRAPERRVVALYDCEASLPDELDFKEGDILVIVDIIDQSWWRAKNAAGKVGLVPSNYLQAA